MTTADTTTDRSGRKIDWWLDQYAICHQDNTNKLIHYICVPAIAASVLGMLWAIPMPASFGVWINLATVAVVLAMIFYLRLSLPLALGMFVFTLPVLLGLRWIESFNPSLILQLSIGVFVVAWIFQFIGHKVEGAKPAFFEDLQFLMIGPLWTLSHVFDKFGIKY